MREYFKAKQNKELVGVCSEKAIVKVNSYTFLPGKIPNAARNVLKNLNSFVDVFWNFFY